MHPLSVTLIQSNLHWENKESNLIQFTEKISKHSATGQLVILPEMFSTGFSMNPAQFAETMDGPTVQWMKKMAIQQKIILTGSVMIAEEGKFFNRLLWVLPNGVVAHYDKRHLFAYGGEDKFYTSGSKRLIASVNGWKVNLLICYDLRFPVWARQQITESPEYDLLVYVANWPERRSHAWRTLLTARAIENQCYVIGVNRIGEDANGINHIGDSMIVDPLGQVLYHSANEESITTHTLNPEHLQDCRNRFPFWKDSDTFSIYQP